MEKIPEKTMISRSLTGHLCPPPHPKKKNETSYIFTGLT